MSWFRSNLRRHSAEAPAAETGPALALEDVEGRPLADLHALAAQAGVQRYRLMRREELVSALTGGAVAVPEPVAAKRAEREPAESRMDDLEPEPEFEPEDEDEGPSRDLPPPLDEQPARRPTRLLALGDTDAARMVELVAPLGHGHRALVSGPPGSGATALLRRIAEGLEAGGAQVLVALVDVRPEEVGEWSARLEVVAADAASSPREQVALAELALERAKRIAERGEDVVLVLDSISRLARAYALARGAGTGDMPGIGPAAVEAVKRWFATARDAGDGSLTIIAAARVESESAFETLVHEALEDSAGTILRLSPELAARGLHPAIDSARSRTLGEEAMIDEEQRRAVDNLRGVARSLDAVEAWEFLAERAREGSGRQPG